MKTPKLKILLLASVWGITSAAAFWSGRHSVAAIAYTPGHGKAYFDGNRSISLNGSAKALSLQDFLRSKIKPDADALKAWADSLDPAQCPGLLADLQKMAGGNPRDALIAAMVASWATRDPKGYLDDLKNVTSPRVRETGVTDALKAMAEQDPKTAVAWLADNKDAVPSQVLTARYRSAIQGLADSDPKAAFAFVQSLDSGSSTANAQIQRQGLNTIADALANQGQFSDALAMFATLPDDQRGTATAELMTQWAQMSPTDATAYIASLSDPTQRATTETEVVRSWARTDPQSAAAWAAQYDQSVSDSSGQQSGQALADAMRSWSRYDLDGPAQFLNTLPPSPATDQAVATFAAQARNTDPASAMNWAAQITDPTMRERTAGSIALRMLATGDTDSLQAAISSNALTPDQVQWLSNLPTDNQQQLLRMSRRMGANFTTTTTRPAPWAPAQ